MTRVSATRRLTYAAYIQTPEWAVRRRQRLAIDGHKCAACKRAELLHVHHKTYDRLGAEDVRRDLITLCEVCHSFVHARHRQAGGSLALITAKAVTEIQGSGELRASLRAVEFVPAHLRNVHEYVWARSDGRQVQTTRRSGADPIMSANKRNRARDRANARHLNGL